MPVKIKKEKKIKQKQKQSQKQIVNIKIGDVKKPVRRRRVVKKVEKVEKPSIQYMYQASGSQPAKQNIGSPEPLARPNLLGGPILQPEEIRQPETEPLQMGRGAEARTSILGGAFIPREEVARQRVLRLTEPEEPSLYSNFPNPETINIEGENPFRAGIEEEVDIEPLQTEAEALQQLQTETEELIQFQKEFGIGDIGGGGRERRPRLYRDRRVLIREILEMNPSYTRDELNDMTTMRIRNIHDNIFRGQIIKR